MLQAITNIATDAGSVTGQVGDTVSQVRDYPNHHGTLIKESANNVIIVMIIARGHDYSYYDGKHEQI